MSSYFKVRLLNIPEHLEDLITQVCFDHNCTGVSEALAYVQPDLTYDPDLVPVDTHSMDVFFENKPDPAFFEAVRAHVPMLRFETTEEQHKDWLEEWKKGFVPFQLVGPYWVVPSWLEAPPQAEKKISIDPGMAFGTGTHATTQMAAYLIHKHLQKNASHLADMTLLDVGTGTAILAMLARMQGIGYVMGLEIDPEARRVARENVKLNKLDFIEIPEDQVEQIHEKFDVVVANIIDGVLVKLKSALLNTMKSTSVLILSGILVEREDLFLEQFMQDSSLKIQRRIEKDEWVSYIMELE